MLKKLLYIISVFILTLYSCYEDKGSYDYIDGDQYKVTISILPVGVVPSLGEPAVFTPKLKFADQSDTMRYTYEYSFPKYGCVCRERNMSYVFDKPEIGKTMDGLFVVTDTVTSVRYYANVSVTYSSPYAVGWLILSDVNGKSVLDFVRMKQDAYETVPNLYGKLTGKELGTHPYALSLNYMGMSPSEPKQFRIFQHGQEGSLLLDCSSYAQVSTVEEEFAGNAPLGFKPIFAAFSISGGWILGNNGDLYSRSYKRNKLLNSSFVNVAADFRDGLNIQYLLYDSPARFLSNLIIYDQLNHRFLIVIGATYPGGEIYAVIPPTDLAATVPSPSALDGFVNHYSVLYGVDAYKGKCFSVLTDEVGAVCLYDFSFDTKTKKTSKVTLKRNTSIASMLNVENARYQLLYNRPYLFFTSGVNQQLLYCYDRNANTYYLYKDFGKRITDLKANYDDGYLSLAVGLENGEFWLLDVKDEVLLQKGCNVLYNTKVDGKIVDVLYKNR